MRGSKETEKGKGKREKREAPERVRDCLFTRDGIGFHYREAGKGVPFFFQHGLGGDVNQPFGLFRPPDGIRLLALDCRAHGETRPVAEPEKISLSSFAEDLLALMEHLGIKQAIIGGISMGAAVALNFVLRFPERVGGLILQRPAWLAEPMGGNAKIYAFIAKLIREQGPTAGQAIFKGSDVY